MENALKNFIQERSLLVVTFYTDSVPDVSFSISVMGTGRKADEESERFQAWAYSKDYIYGAGLCPQDDESADIAVHTETTMEQCKQSCDADDSCSLFVYNLAENSCRLLRRICASDVRPPDKTLRVFAKGKSRVSLKPAAHW
jgi:hypothetical protein